MTDNIVTSSKAQVAIEFSCTEYVVRHTLLTHDFTCAADLIDYLMCHEEDLTLRIEKRASFVKKRNDSFAARSSRLCGSSTCHVDITLTVIYPCVLAVNRDSFIVPCPIVTCS